MEMKLTPRFYQDGERIFGPGVAELMQQVQVHRSLRSAAQAMEMAYSKAWRIIRNAEEGFGCKLLNSTIGGRNGGGFRGKPAPAEPASFEDRLKQFMAASDSKLSELRQSERRSSRRGGRK